MVTREQYNKALDIIEEYHKQIIPKRERLLVDDWLREHPQIDAKIRRALTSHTYTLEGLHGKRLFTYMDEIEKWKFLSVRFVGRKSWYAFTQLIEQ